MFVRIGSLLLATLLVAAATAATARDIYVNNLEGDDIFDGSIPDSNSAGQGAFKSITRALRAAHWGDRILLAKTDQPYHESISLVGSRHSGSPEQPFVLEGNGAVLDGSQIVPPEAWQFAGGDLFRFQPRQMKYSQLYLDGAPALRHPLNAGGKPLDPKEWMLRDGFVYFRVEPGRLPQDYAFSYTALQTGITLYKVENAVVSNLVVQGFALDGVNFHDAVGPSIIAGSTLRGNGRSGVAVVSASQVDVRSCLIGDNGNFQVLVTDYSLCNLSNSDVIDGGAGKWEVRDQGKLLLDGAAVPRQ